MEPVTHVITSYRRLAKGETGWTRLGSKRLDSLSVIDWVVAHTPDGVFTVEPGEHVTVVRIDLDKAAELYGEG